jgi:arylsulfotransferase ASST
VLDTEARPSSRLLTRRGLLKSAGAAAGVAALGGVAFGSAHPFDERHRLPRLRSFASHNSGPVRSFVSRPDLRPPAVTITGGGQAPGYLFVGPSAGGGAQAGPLMLDHEGEPVWFAPISRALWLSNFRAGRYRGQPVLTWWEGRMTSEGYGRGEGVIADTSYRELARVRAGNGREIDVHEFLVTPEGTALFVCYPQTSPADLSSVGGPSNGTAQESIVQEVDVESGRVLLEWRSLEHIAVEESYQRPAAPYDYVHINSIVVAPDGNLLVSARCTWALYKLDRHTGRVIWRLGGKRSDFQLADGGRFAWQHDAKQPTASHITLFDDGNAAFDDGSGMTNTESQSRGVVLEVDERRRTARLARSYRHPRPVLANAMGSFQTLTDGHVLIGWGSEPLASEFSADGKQVADLRLGSKHDSYRAYRYHWAGSPADRPAVVATRAGRHPSSIVHVSWNGATEVADWLVHTGPRANSLHAAGVAERHGFETVIPIGAQAGYVAVTALDASGRKLASSMPVRL